MILFEIESSGFKTLQTIWQTLIATQIGDCNCPCDTNIYTCIVNLIDNLQHMSIVISDDTKVYFANITNVVK